MAMFSTIAQRATWVVALSCLFFGVTERLFADSHTTSGVAEASVEVGRYERFATPDLPRAQHTDPSTSENTDTGKAVHEWVNACDDFFGGRPWLDDHGIVFTANITADFSLNFQGGVSTHDSIARDLFNLNLTADTQKLFGWEGGTFFVNFQVSSGEDGGTELAGANVAASDIDADGLTQVSELWYEQVLFEGKLRVKFGKVDANSEFSFSDNREEFMNGQMGYPVIAGFPTYPDPAMSLNVFIAPVEWLYLGAGLYDGAGNEGYRTGSRGPSTFFSSDPADLFLIGEIGLKWSLGDDGLEGRLGVGEWGHTGTFTRFDGNNQDGTMGFYVTFDQKLHRENPKSEDDAQGLGVFVTYGKLNGEVNAIDHSISVGLAWMGVLPDRDSDVAGLGLQWSSLSDDPASGLTDDDELVCECFYKIQITKFLSIKPDLQWVINPGGAGARDALVGTIRVAIDL